MPLFVADVLGAAIRDGLAIYGKDNLHEGDIVITNDAGTIGQHLNNVVMYTPVFAPDTRELIAFFVVVVHWLDVGGRVIGSLSKYATDIFQEGIQFRTVKLRSRGEPVRGNLPHDPRQHAVSRRGHGRHRRPDRRLPDGPRPDGGTDRDATAPRLSTTPSRRSGISRKRSRARSSRRFPDGTYSADAFLDNDGLNAGTRCRCKVKVIVAGDEMTIDLSDLPPEKKSTMNAGRSGGGQSVARLAFRYLIIPERGRQRRQLSAAASRAAGRHGDERRSEFRQGPLQSRAADADRSRHPRARLARCPDSGRGRSLCHLLDHPLRRQPARQQRAVPMQRQRIRRLGRAVRRRMGPGRSAPCATATRARSRSKCRRRAIRSRSRTMRCGPIPAAPVQFRGGLGLTKSYRRERAVPVHLDLRPHRMSALGPQWRAVRRCPATSW